MEEKSGADAIERYSFLVAFANDGIIDHDELRFMQRLALADGHVDAEERSVLRALFARVDAQLIDASLRAEIEEFRARYGI